jgi:hypothetical protein
LSFESRNAIGRVAAKGRSLPAVLCNALDVQQQIVEVVRQRGGGWAIENWSDTQFVLDVINHSQSSPVQYSEAQQFLADRCKQEHCGSFLIKLYVKAMSKNFTADMHKTLVDSTPTLESMDAKHTRKQNWDKFVQSSPSLRSCPDSFVVYKFGNTRFGLLLAEE